MSMRIDVWTDIVCPYCYLGKKNFELALAEFPHASEVEVHWRSFQLDPGIERMAPAPLAQTIAAKFGISLEQSEQSQRQVAEAAAAVGLDFDWRNAKYGNTADAHRLVHLAGAHGLATETETRLMRAYFAEGVQIGDPAQLQRLGEEIGLPADEVREMLSGDRFAEDVRADQRQAQELGAGGVPFFVLGGRYGVSGAQPVEAFTQALQRAWDEQSAV